MAYYIDQNEEEKINSGQPLTTGAQTSVVGTQAPVPNPSPNTPDNPGNFVGIKSYIDANKQQAQKLGDQTANVINESANQARQGLSGLQNQFGQQAVGKQNDQEALNKANQAETLNDQQKQTLKDQYNAQYTGPSDLTDLGEYTNVGNKINKAFQNIQNSGTEEGRMGLISQVNQKPRTQGMNTFDNALLQSGGGREKIAQSAQANQDINDQYLSNANLMAQQQAADAKAMTDATRNQTQTAIQGAQNTLGQNISQRLANMRQGIVDTNNLVTQDLGDNPYDLDERTMELFGLNPNDRLFNLKLNDYLTMANPSDLSQSNIATNEEFLRSQALADIMGGNGVLDMANIGQAGTAPGTKVNKSLLESDRAAAQSAYNDAYNTQTKGVLDRSFLDNPNASGGYAGLIPGALTDRRDIESSTPQEIESFWLPLFERAANAWNDPIYTDAIRKINKSLDQWRNKFGYKNVVNPPKTITPPRDDSGSLPVNK